MLRALAAALVVVVCAVAPTADAASAPIAPTGLAATPPLGVESWNATGCTAALDEQWVLDQADALVRTGLRDTGYRYVIVDDCWALPARDAAGRLVADPARFPHGMAALADAVHARGLLFGLYTSAGTMTCDARGFPGGLGHERADAASFASWGVDYVKDDDCHTAGTDAYARYSVMATALRDTGRPIVYAVCDKGNSRPWLWAPGIAQLWRTTPDITDDWAAVARNARATLAVAGHAAPGAWNDPDMLEIGNGGLTPAEQRSHLALWSMLSAPLLAGTDVSRASPATLALLGNRALVALDQDPPAAPLQVLRDDPGGLLVLRRVRSDGTTVTSVSAMGDTPVTVPAGIAGRDLVTASTVEGGTVVGAHDTVVV